MQYTKKSFEELDIIDDFLINAITTNAEVGVPFCRKLLSVLMQREIGQIRIVAQRTIPAQHLGLKGIRMDVEVEESTCFTINEDFPITNVYDIEPHKQKDLHFARHNRFYQAKIDSRYLKSGEVDFRKLPNLYVITITDFDPFGYDYMMYTINNHCKEMPSLQYDDGLQFIYFNTKGKKGGSREIQTMLKYIEESKVENAVDDATKELHSYVSMVKMLPEVKQGYMKFDELMAYARQEGLRQGLREGHEEGLKKGLKEGHEEGLREGHEEGLREGHEEGREEVIRDCLIRNKDCNKVADFLGIPIEEVRQVEETMLLRRD